MSRLRALLSIAIACASSACSFLAFDDFTESTPADGGVDAGAEAIAPSGDSAASDTSSSEAGAVDPYGDVVRADAPVAWYRFEEDTTANSAKDSAGNLTAELVGGAMGFGAAGISGRGISSDGTGSGFTLGDTLGFAGKSPFSLEAWVKPKAGKEHYLFDKREDVGGGLSGWLLYVSPDLTPHFENWGTLLTAWGSPIPAGWVHVVVTVSFNGNAADTRLWINGQPTADHNGDPDANTPATATSFNLLSPFAGEADEVAIYDKALTSDRVLAHYLAGKP